MKSFLTDKQVTSGYLAGSLFLLIPAWMMRDAELVERLRQIESDAPLALYDQSILCGDLPTCFRLSHKLVIFVLDQLLKITLQPIFGFLGDVVTDHPKVVQQYLLNIGPFMLFRLLVLVGILSLFQCFFRSWRRTSIAVVGTALLLSGLPFRLAAEFREMLLAGVGAEPDNLVWHFSRQSTIFLLEHDYAGLVAALGLPLWIAQKPFTQRSVFQFAAAGFLLAIVFEHLALVLCIALIWSSRNKLDLVLGKRAAVILLGWCIPTVALTVFSQKVRPDGRENLSLMIDHYRANNFSNLSIVLQLSFGFFGSSYLLGRILRNTFPRTFSRFCLASQIQRGINGVIIGLLLSYFFGMFVSGVLSEFGRQTIGTQILIFVAALGRNSQAKVARRGIWRRVTSATRET
jgi:hypothetical protein